MWHELTYSVLWKTCIIFISIPYNFSNKISREDGSVNLWEEVGKVLGDSENMPGACRNSERDS